MTATESAALPELDGGPYDIEFFFDPGCPFAWQTSVWMRRVRELRGVTIGWRFISLRFINENNDVDPAMLAAQEIGLRFHRVCAAARAEHGNEAVDALYKNWGERLWYSAPTSSEFGPMLINATEAVQPAEVIAAAGLPAELIEAADDSSWDELIRAESDEALRRTGSDVGTPIITYNPPNGNSLFGPVISSIPDDDTALAFYDALRTFADFPAFSEIKRSARAQLDLPLFK